MLPPIQWGHLHIKGTGSEERATCVLVKDAWHKTSFTFSNEAPVWIRIVCVGSYFRSPFQSSRCSPHAISYVFLVFGLISVTLDFAFDSNQAENIKTFHLTGFFFAVSRLCLLYTLFHVRFYHSQRYIRKGSRLLLSQDVTSRRT